MRSCGQRFRQRLGLGFEDRGVSAGSADHALTASPGPVLHSRQRQTRTLWGRWPCREHAREFFVIDFAAARTDLGQRVVLSSGRLVVARRKISTESAYIHREEETRGRR
eukprot:3376263-Rhodomonas_salina.1